MRSVRLSAVALGASLCAFATNILEEDWPAPCALDAVPPTPADAADALAAEDHALIRGRTVCVASTKPFAGRLADSLVYRYRRENGFLYVGYFVHWSTERPWGGKSALEALLIDSMYSHFFFVLPGLQYAMYGPGDVEGALVVYEEQEDGSLRIHSGQADDEYHDPVALSRVDLELDSERTILLTSTWSHQLGTQDAAEIVRRERPPTRCYRGNELLPMPPALAERFRLGTDEEPLRAKPAWKLEPIIEPRVFAGSATTTR